MQSRCRSGCCGLRGMCCGLRGVGTQAAVRGGSAIAIADGPSGVAGFPATARDPDRSSAMTSPAARPDCSGPQWPSPNSCAAGRCSVRNRPGSRVRQIVIGCLAVHRRRSVRTRSGSTPGSGSASSVGQFGRPVRWPWPTRPMPTGSAGSRVRAQSAGDAGLLDPLWLQSAACSTAGRPTGCRVGTTVSARRG
jgi:hypothetical protein